MAIEVLLADRFGKVLTDVKPNVRPISWRLNKIGKTALTFVKTDPKATEQNLRYGNRVLIRFSEDVGLPAWGGTIEPPLDWSESTITVDCRGIEYLLQYRRTGKTRAFYDAPVGNIFHNVLREMELEESIGLGFGQIWLGGRGHSPRYHMKNLWWVITESLVKMEGCDVKFTPQIANGKITFLAEIFERLGEDKSSKYSLSEEFNVVYKPTMTEQGPIINEFAAIGSGSTWGDERQVSIFEVGESRQRYGLRQDSGIYSGVVVPTTLDRHASTEAKASSRGKIRLALEAANATPALFSQYDTGDTVQCKLPSWGWNGYDQPVRILTREYDPAVKDKAALVVEEESTWEPVPAGGGEPQIVEEY